MRGWLSPSGRVGCAPRLGARLRDEGCDSQVCLGVPCGRRVHLVLFLMGDRAGSPLHGRETLTITFG